jgi:NAD-dependent deacetylase
MLTDRVTDELRARFLAARRVAALTGAGISAESGVPTFRGGGGTAIWEWRGRPVSELSSAELLAADPKLVWEWFDYRRGLVKNVRPNPGHAALAKWAARFEAFTLVTQNIDGLHAAAGSKRPLELHGNLWRGRCVRCGATRELPETPLREMPPRCACGAPLRPDVVLFGEMLPEGVYAEALEAASRCDLFFVVGTSAVVYPAAYLPMEARSAGAYVIEVNPEETELTGRVEATVLGKAGEILPEFERAPR